MPIGKFRFLALCEHAVIALIGMSACACTSVRYYAHVAHGQAQLVTHKRSLDTVIAAPATDATTAARLTLARDARRFASQQLHLPDNRSYTSYVDLKRPYVVWNVFAAPTFSVEPIEHCFPIAGCVPYRGYFDETLANAEGQRLRNAGDDVFVGGVAAYSTLGWFADPILSSMLRWDDDELVGTIFHELAHQLIYVKDDTAFNESFATFVQHEGLREWRAARGLPPPSESSERIDDEFIRLILDLRERLRSVYASGIGSAAMQNAKQSQIEEFRARYRQWAATQADSHRYDAFVAAPINNAALLPFGLYDQWTPAFAALFAQAHRNWTSFYVRVRELAGQAKTQREGTLNGLAGQSGP